MTRILYMILLLFIVLKMVITMVVIYCCKGKETRLFREKAEFLKVLIVKTTMKLGKSESKMIMVQNLRELINVNVDFVNESMS